MSIESENFRIEAGELKFLRKGELPTTWGDVVDIDGPTFEIEHAYIPNHILSEDSVKYGCGIMTAETCLEIAALLKRMDQGES